MQRTKWVYLNDDINKAEKIIEFEILKNTAMNFFNLQSKLKSARLTYSERLKIAFIGRTLLNNSFFYLKSLIEPSKNIHIREHIDAFKAMNENLGRIEKRLDEHEKELSSIERTKDYNPFGASDKGSLQIERYIGEMMEIFENLVYIPIRRAINKIKSIKPEQGKILLINQDLFLYYVFINILHTSDVMGSWTREEQKQTNITNYTPPPENPENAKYESTDPNNPIKNIEDNLFSEEENVVV